MNMLSNLLDINSISDNVLLFSEFSEIVSKIFFQALKSKDLDNIVSKFLENSYFNMDPQFECSQRSSKHYLEKRIFKNEKVRKKGRNMLKI